MEYKILLLLQLPSEGILRLYWHYLAATIQPYSYFSQSVLLFSRKNGFGGSSLPEYVKSSQRLVGA